MPGQTTTCSGNKPPRRNERRKARDRKRWPDRTGQATSLYAHVGLGKIGFVEFVDVSIGASDSKPCYDFRRPKGPVLQNTSDNAVAAPTDKRGFVMPDFDRSGVSRCGMVYGHGGGYPQGRPHGVIRVLNHHAHPSCFKTRLVASESHNGAKTMTKVIPLVRTAAPIITASRCAAPIQSPADTTDPQIIGLHIAAENALASALHLLRSIDCDLAKLQQATGRAARATTLLKRACAAQVAGGGA